MQRYQKKSSQNALRFVIPAEAGIQKILDILPIMAEKVSCLGRWIPACAGMTRFFDWDFRDQSHNLIRITSISRCSISNHF